MGGQDLGFGEELKVAGRGEEFLDAGEVGDGFGEDCCGGLEEGEGVG